MTTINTIIRRPTAFLPVALSLAALTLVLAHIALYGITHQPDEGAAAHLWQLLMALQLPIIAFFAIRYVPQQPRQASLILAIQLLSALLACAPVYFLKL